jgi:hypothetical protein
VSNGWENRSDWSEVLNIPEVLVMVEAICSKAPLVRCLGCKGLMVEELPCCCLPCVFFLLMN